MCVDRDGVINIDVGPPGVIRVDDLKLELGAAHAVAILRQAGHHVVCVTNQSAVGKGLIDDDDLAQIHDRLRTELIRESDFARINAILVATEVGGGNDDDGSRRNQQEDLRNARRKPGCGMILEAMKMTGATDAEVIMIGDRETDMMAAKNAGRCSRILILTEASTSDRERAAAVDAAAESRGRILVHESLLAREYRRTADENHGDRVRALLDVAPEEEDISSGAMEPLRVYASLLDFALDYLIRNYKTAAAAVSPPP